MRGTQRYKAPRHCLHCGICHGSAPAGHHLLLVRGTPSACPSPATTHTHTSTCSPQSSNHAHIFKKSGGLPAPVIQHPRLCPHPLLPTSTMSAGLPASMIPHCRATLMAVLRRQHKEKTSHHRRPTLQKAHSCRGLTHTGFRGGPAAAAAHASNATVHMCSCGSGNAAAFSEPRPAKLRAFARNVHIALAALVSLSTPHWIPAQFPQSKFLEHRVEQYCCAYIFGHVILTG